MLQNSVDGQSFDEEVKLRIEKNFDINGERFQEKSKESMKDLQE
jgi:hypothetical protein